MKPKKIRKLTDQQLAGLLQEYLAVKYNIEYSKVVVNEETTVEEVRYKRVILTFVIES